MGSNLAKGDGTSGDTMMTSDPASRHRTKSNPCSPRVTHFVASRDRDGAIVYSKDPPLPGMARHRTELLDSHHPLRGEIERAIREKRVFVATTGRRNTPLNRSLKRRHFVQKFDLSLAPPPPANPARRRKKKSVQAKAESPDEAAGLTDDDSADDQSRQSVHSEDDSDSVKELKSNLVRNVTPSFIWTTKVRPEVIRRAGHSVLVNHYPATALFTTKNGLTQTLRSLAWTAGRDSDEIYPRSYRIGCTEEMHAFREDFKLTACVAVLKMVLLWHAELTTAKKAEEDDSPEDTLVPESDKENFQHLIQDEGNLRPHPPPQTEGPKDHPQVPGLCPGPRDHPHVPGSCPGTKDHPQVPGKVLSFALDACRVFLRGHQLEDLDEPLDPDESSDMYLQCSEGAWRGFLNQYYHCAHEDARIPGWEGHVNECHELLTRIREVRPMHDVDGVRNMWICKPGALSRGRGITCQTSLDTICGMVAGPGCAGKREGRLVVQKYLESCCLIHNTKFDIRQWFLVTDWNPLTVWFYRDCYIRLCSQQYDLSRLDLEVHLSNNSIQANYVNDASRSSQLPKDNMMTSQQFAQYLRSQGHGDVYEREIYPKMKQCIVWTMQCCQDSMEATKGCFELFGADFMIAEDLSVWLIEINCSPTMMPSTAITRRMCADVLEDLVKVVVDRREDKRASTGGFELALRQDPVAQPTYTGQNFWVEGTAIKKPPPPRNLSATRIPSERTPRSTNSQSSRRSTEQQLRQPAPSLIERTLEETAFVHRSFDAHQRSSSTSRNKQVTEHRREKSPHHSPSSKFKSNHDRDTFRAFTVTQPPTLVIRHGVGGGKRAEQPASFTRGSSVERGGLNTCLPLPVFKPSMDGVTRVYGQPGAGLARGGGGRQPFQTARPERPPAALSLSKQSTLRSELAK